MNARYMENNRREPNDCEPLVQREKGGNALSRPPVLTTGKIVDVKKKKKKCKVTQRTKKNR